MERKFNPQIQKVVLNSLFFLGAVVAVGGFLMLTMNSVNTELAWLKERALNIFEKLG